MTNIVVTGGAGFIGANLCRTLVDTKGVGSVVALDDLSTGLRTNLPADCGVRLREGSILDPSALDDVCSGVDVIVHLAARPSVPRSLEDPVATHTANATGTLEVLEAARRHGGPQVIVASSSSVYGANPVLPKREDLAPAPLSPYAASKLATEAYATAYAHSFGIDVLAFRFFNVFGPLQSADHAYAAVIPRFIANALAGRPLTVHGDGLQTRDFTYVGTVTRVLADAAVRKVTSLTPVNLAFGTRTTLLDLIARLEAVLGRTLAVEHAPPRKGDVRDSQADVGELRALFPTVTPASLDDGLSATVDWFRAAG
jgi:UDP-glucose 4-epimerase